MIQKRTEALIAFSERLTALRDCKNCGCLIKKPCVSRNVKTDENRAVIHKGYEPVEK
jgi:hypothetical protein